MTGETKIQFAKKWLKEQRFPDSLDLYRSEPTIASRVVDEATLKEILDETDSFKICAKIWYFSLDDNLKLEALKKIEKILNKSAPHEVTAIHEYCIKRGLYKEAGVVGEEISNIVKKSVTKTTAKIQKEIKKNT
jgi:hypothetical protein